MVDVGDRVEVLPAPGLVFSDRRGKVVNRTGGSVVVVMDAPVNIWFAHQHIGCVGSLQLEEAQVRPLSVAMDAQGALA